ncbi:MAG: ABC transporter ATP-binding protein [Nitrospinota bacterium]
MSSPVLEVRGLKKYFPLKGHWIARALARDRGRFVHAVENVDLTLREGEILGVVGESGCGKSTLAFTILKLYEPTSGVIRFLGEDVAPYRRKDLRRFRRYAQIVFQDPYQSLNPRFTVFDTVREPLVIHGLAKRGPGVRDQVVEALEQVQLRPPQLFLYRYPHELSGGQRQRVAIARAMVVRPRFLVADEPVSMLDVSVRAAILDLLNQLRRQFRLTILYISHDISTVRYLCDRTAIMYLGRIVELGETDRIIEKPLHPYGRSLLAAVPVSDPTVTRQRVRLKGEVSSSVNRPTGCFFHPRCQDAFFACPKVTPALLEEETGHYVACHLYRKDLSESGTFSQEG